MIIESSSGNQGVCAKKYSYWQNLRERDYKKYKQKRKEELIRYISRKFEQLPIGVNISELIHNNRKYRNWHCRLTRLLFDDKLPRECKLCKSFLDIHIHHIRYKYPIKRCDLVRLCRRCHLIIHQMIEPITKF